jgi:very-short-patch-repair endonuclease
MFEFSVEYTGEDLLTNLSLVERMKHDFALSIAELDEEDTPESYFRKFSKILKEQPRWRICRQVTLTLLQFGKLLMFLDLDATRHSALLSNPRIQELLGGVSSKNSGTSYSDVYELDAPDVESVAPALIYDADSSQHSALIDALSGKNIVIEGPPGTGKSQTITNLIATFLVAGKNVLFVSEKLAALEVVRRRLDHAGIGDFCLELHSHKTKKDTFLRDIQQRILRQRSLRNPSDLEDRLALIRRSKRELIEYVNLINQPFGRLKKSIFDIFWSRSGYLQRFPEFEKFAERLSLGHADAISPAQKEEERLLVEIYQQNFAGILAKYQSVSAHPWFGVQNGELSYAQVAEAILRIGQLRGTLDELLQSSAKFASSTGLINPGSFQTVQSLVDVVELLPAGFGDVHADLLPKLNTEECRGFTRQFIQQISDRNEEMLELRKYFVEVRPLDVEAKDFREALSALQGLKLGANTKSDLLELRRDVNEVRKTVRSCTELISAVAQRLAIEFIPAWESTHLLSNIASILKGTNFDILVHRHPSLEITAFDAVRKEAWKKADSIRRLRELLAKEYVLTRLPSSDELWKHASSISSSSFLGRWLGKGCTDAKSCYLSIRKQDQKVSWDLMAGDLKELAEYLDSVKEFTSNTRYAEAFGQCFVGLETPFEDVEALVKWYGELRAAFTSYHRMGEMLMNSFKTASIDTLRNLTQFLIENETTIDAVSKCIAAIEAFPWAAERSYRRFQGLQEYLTELEAIYGLIDKAATYLEETPFFPDVTIDEMLALIERLSQYLTLENTLQQNSAAKSLLGASFEDCLIDPKAVKQTIDLAEMICRSRIPESIQAWLLAADCLERIDLLRHLLGSIGSIASKYSVLWNEFVELTRLDPRKWYSACSGDWTSVPLTEIGRRLDHANDSGTSLSDLLEYLRASKELIEAKLVSLISLAEDGCLEPGQLKDAYEFSIFNGLCDHVLRSHPRLISFSRTKHERIRDEFARLDNEMLGTYRKRAAYLISRREVPQGENTGPVRGYTNLALLEHEIQKQRGHIPIRSLLNRSHAALLALKPCFMMGPMSVAQYLAPGKFHFDLIIMDEASQLKPEDALGAVARGSQVVVVGDPKQLPPTSFFDSMFKESGGPQEEDDNLAIEESESILDRACEVYKPIRQLRWHYRSRHESLIAFSNHRFYDRNLILFPSPQKDSPTLGVKRHFIENGVYAGRTNRPEAEFIVHAILKHMDEFSEESLGVATFNSTQRDLIEELLDAEVKRNLTAQAYLAKWNNSPEPFFVKNLETVQGDERDCMFVSFTYGRDHNGNMYQRFGPINGHNGHRRLNVLLTRAKNRTEIFTSMLSDDIVIGEDSSLGVKTMRGCLAFAETGTLDQPTDGGGLESNEFELCVAAAVEGLGFNVVPQVGVAGYFIDLAVCHPRKPGSYILGIECDGATYHSAKSARDRDRLREANLRNLGWDIHRIWSTDWYKNRKTEIERIKKRLEQLVAQARAI